MQEKEERINSECLKEGIQSKKHNLENTKQTNLDFRVAMWGKRS